MTDKNLILIKKSIKVLDAVKFDPGKEPIFYQEIQEAKNKLHYILGCSQIDCIQKIKDINKKI